MESSPRGGKQKVYSMKGTQQASPILPPDLSAPLSRGHFLVLPMSFLPLETLLQTTAW